MRIPHRVQLLRPALLAALAGLVACSSAKPAKQAERLTPQQFAQGPAAAPPAQDSQKPAPAPAPVPASAPAAASRPAPAPLPTPEPPPDTLALRSFVGEPDLEANPAQPVARPIVLESVIGQINGRPLFASEILTPLDGKLRALAEQVKGDRNAFVRTASTDIIGVITNKVRDELILAEAQASLPAEARQGLFYFLGKIQENLVSTQSGSALQADEALRETTGRTLQQEARDRLERELITTELRNKIVPRVNVPWRLIRQEYERNYDTFNPPGAATLRVIAVPAADADAVRRAEEAIASGPFAAAAAMDFNSFLRSEAGLAKRDLEGPYAQAELFADEAMTRAAQKLQPGQTTPQITWGDRLAWIHLESLERPPGISLYDAQLGIETSLRERKFIQEREIYFKRLLERGSFTRIESMVQEAMTIAIERYLPPQSQ